MSESSPLALASPFGRRGDALAQQASGGLPNPKYLGGFPHEQLAWI
ncbi:hypothetical protein [Nostoc sp. CHAB 5715]|nr:hypothetical protein [Nostoc sp. CHAB 5715]MCC5623370.1 hypothetical protein [Nostoc sp. CHAB 5715]